MTFDRKPWKLFELSFNIEWRRNSFDQNNTLCSFIASSSQPRFNWFNDKNFQWLKYNHNFFARNIIRHTLSSRFGRSNNSSSKCLSHFLNTSPCCCCMSHTVWIYSEFVLFEIFFTFWFRMFVSFLTNWAPSILFQYIIYDIYRSSHNDLNKT